MFVLGGYEIEDDLYERSSSWEPDDACADLGEAIEAADTWLVAHADGVVEVIEVRGANGAVVRLVSNAGIEVIAPEWPNEKPEGTLRRRKRIVGEWFHTPPGAFLTALIFFALGAWMIVDNGSDSSSNSRLPPWLVRPMGIVTVGFISWVALTSLYLWVRRRSQDSRSDRRR